MIPTPRDLPPLLGESRPFLELIERVSRVARLDRPVLVIGERGTGKELIAARLHFLSPRWDQPFIKLNCAALPQTLLETEMEVEKRLLAKALEANRYNQRATARHLGLTYDQLRNQLRKHGLLENLRS